MTPTDEACVLCGAATGDRVMAMVEWLDPVESQHWSWVPRCADRVACRFAPTTATPVPDLDVFVARTFTDLRRRLVGSPPNVDGIDAAIGYALNDCEVAILAALEKAADVAAIEALTEALSRPLGECLWQQDNDGDAAPGCDRPGYHDGPCLPSPKERP